MSPRERRAWLKFFQDDSTSTYIKNCYFIMSLPFQLTYIITLVHWRFKFASPVQVVSAWLNIGFMWRSKKFHCNFIGEVAGKTTSLRYQFQLCWFSSELSTPSVFSCTNETEHMASFVRLQRRYRSFMYLLIRIFGNERNFAAVSLFSKQLSLLSLFDKI